ncbi:MAG: hypothetical protein HY303_17745 [Candidatus Wallbacteria bacterium]|nr:hypothetical protein [Candidatus Wallbacteria bacterium]
MSSFHAWYDRVYPDLSRHGLWLRGGELNTLPVTEYARRDFRILFARLSTYEDTGYSFTHRLLYQLASRIDGIYPDLAYLPPPRDGRMMTEAKVPWLLGTQSKCGPDGFDLIGFSNSIVQELVNLITLLARSGIPLGKRERLGRPDLPLILLGGANALYSSAIWCDDPPVDGLFVGEDDVTIARLLETLRDGKRAGKSKAQLLVELEELPGFLQPERPRSTAKSFISNLNRSQALEAGPIYYLEDQAGSSHLQISEGCPCFCSFCAESWDRKPYRERSAPVLREIALRAKAAMGLDSIDLYSFNFNMHSGFYQVLWDLVPLFKSIGLKSQRFDLLARDPQMVEFQHAIEKASHTCGLEGISPRLRRYLHKNLENDELHDSLVAIFGSRARQLKVFLIATGLEEEQDFLALRDLLGHINEVREQYHASTRVIMSITPLVRFPWTPLEFEDAPTLDRLQPILETAGRLIEAAGFDFRASADLPEYWFSQILVRTDSRAIYPALISALRKTSFVYYREVPESFRLAFENALVAEGADVGQLMKGYSLEESRSKPWARVSTGVLREFLWAEVERARGYQEIDYCLGRSWTKAKCFHCGGCPTKEHVRNIVLARQDRPYKLDAFQTRVASSHADRCDIAILTDLGPPAAGVPRPLVGAALARALMLGVPALREHYAGYAGSVWEPAKGGPCRVIGHEAIRLRFKRAGLPLLDALWSDADSLARVNSHLDSWGRVVGPAPAGWHPRELELEAAFPYGGDSYLTSLHLAHVRKRAGEHTFRYEFPAKAIARGLVRGMIVDSQLGQTRVAIQLGPKYQRLEIDELAKNLFRSSGRSDWVRVRVSSKGQGA